MIGFTLSSAFFRIMPSKYAALKYIYEETAENDAISLDTMD